MESQSNPLDMTSSMMSQTTATLLAHMATDVSLNGSGASLSRRPLHPIDNHDDRGEATDHNANAGKATRVMGAHETHYREKYDSFVCKTIRRAARTGAAALPKFHEMDSRQKQEAMSAVDALLERLECSSSAANGVFAVTNAKVQERADETFGSATTLGERDDSASAPGSPSLLNSIDCDSDGHHSPFNTNDPSASSMTTLTAASPSLLEESMVLLSDEEDAHNDDKDLANGANHAIDTISPIERARRASSNESPALLLQMESNKRCASNSGKRGYKSKVRLDSDVESTLNHFVDNDGIFSCGSPIQTTFKEDGEDESRFSYNDLNDVDLDALSADEDLSKEDGLEYEQSQWSAVRNVDPKLTYSEGEEDDSPVRRRAIHFGHSQQQLSIANKKAMEQRMILGADADDTGISLEGKMADMAMQDGNNSDDPIHTVRNLSRRAKALESQGVDSSLLDEVAPTDIRMRDGAHFRMDPLKCRQTTKKSKNRQTNAARLQSKSKATRNYESESENELSDPEPSFTDPLSRYPPRIAARLNSVYDFIAGKEEQENPADIDTTEHYPCGALLSMPIDECVSITTKVLLQSIKSSRLHQRSNVKSRYTPNVPKIKDVLAGGTLIVLRDKADLPRWEVALREHTSLSVMNHAEMQSSLRKLANTAAKCAGFDVVLSTYDAMKAKEVTVPVDENGRAMLDGDSTDANETDGGWLTSRVAGSQSGVHAPRKCHQLSVLHRMSWHRLILMDVLGRKGFLIKPGTARAQSVVAINSKSRFVFFEKEEDVTGMPVEKFKEDRRQLRSVIAALQLPTNLKLDKFISHHVLDVNKVGRGNINQLNNNSSSEEESFEEYTSDDENLTEPCSY